VSFKKRPFINMSNTVPFTHPSNPSIPHPDGLYIFLSEANTVIYYGCSLCNYQHQDWRKLVQHAQYSKHAKAVGKWRQRQQDDMNNDTQEALQSVTNNDESTVRSDNMNFPDDSIPTFEFDDMADEYLSTVSLQRTVIVADDTENNFELIDLEVASSIMISDVLRDTFAEHSTTYLYLYMQEAKNHKGKSVLIASSLLSNKTLVDLVDDEDTEIHFALLDLLIHSTSKQRLKFITFLRLLLSSRKIFSMSSTQEGIDAHQKQFSIPLPTSIQEVRTKYTTGPNSLWNCIPSPIVVEGRNKKGKITHAFVSVAQCIGMYLAMGGRISVFDELNLRSQMKYKKFTRHKSWTNNSTVIFFSLWSDSFECNGTKTNRGKSLWLISMTITCPRKQIMDKNEQSHWRATFPLGIAKSNDHASQDKILSHIIDEVNEMATSPRMFYSSFSRKPIHLFTSINLILQDQIERRKLNYVMNGNSRPSCRWGFVVPHIDSIATKIPACAECEERTKKPDWSYNNQVHCGKCFNWDVTRSQGTITLNNVYLLNTLKEAQELMGPEMKYSYNQLKAFTSSKGMNNAASVKLYEHAENVKIKEAVRLRISTEDVLNDTMEYKAYQKLEGDALYKSWEGSPLYKSITHDIPDIIDAPMHALFLGIVKTTMSFVLDFIKERKIATLFKSFIKKKMAPLLDQFKLSWFVLLDFSNDEPLQSTGWVSENYLAFSRIFLWYVSSLRTVEDTRSFSPIDEGKPVQSWSRIQLQTFIERNSIDIPLTAPTTDLKAAVKEYQNYMSSSSDHEGPEDISNACSVEDIIMLVMNLQNLLQSTMGPMKSDTRNLIEKYSRLFLSSLHKVCCNLGKHDVFLSVWNTSSLLNMGRMVELFGHISCFWEGGLRGEALIQKFKAEKGLLASRAPISELLDTVLRRRSLELITMDEKTYDVKQLKMVHSYGSIYEVNVRLKKQEALSVVYDDNVSLISIHDNWHRLLFEPCFHDDVGTFYVVTLEEEPYEELLDDTGKSNTAVPMILLPNVHKLMERKCYCVVSMSWETISFD
jgi:hypothetical protein